MEALQAALAKRPALLPLLEEAARVQACGRCSLRLAAVRAAAAYAADCGLPPTAAEVVQRLRDAGAAAGAGAEQPVAAAAAEAAAPDAAAKTGSKRRRLDVEQQVEGVPGQVPPAAQPVAASGGPAAAVCPLCLGILQPATGGGGGLGRSTWTLTTTRSTLNDPQRRAEPLFGGAAAANAAAVIPAAAQQSAGADGPPGGPHAAPVVTQHAVPVASLAAAAACIAEEFEFDCFALEVTLPASLAVRHQALVWRLRSTAVPGATEALAAAVDVKEAAKLCYTAALAAKLGRTHDVAAALHISLSASHPQAAAECGWLAGANGGGGGKRQRRGRQQQRWQQGAPAGEADVPALTDAAVQQLAGMSQAEFAAACPQGAAALAPPPSPAALQLAPWRKPVHVGGRYLKLRRGIPQSPWIIDGGRKGEGSVQEAIERAVLPAFRADSFTLVAAGREDIDVRMLGEGRPFILEIQNARAAMPPPERLAALGEGVQQASAGGVAVRGLFAASPAQLAVLKEGEQSKEKSYVAVCWTPRQLSEADVATLEGTRDLEVLQQTPVRVLHRRANLERPKAVRSMRVQRLGPEAPPGYFALHLRTQAGTYIKEFVHGDLGRSRPCLGDLLGGCRAQIVSLDVAAVHMPFGPLEAAAQQGTQQQEQQ
ncbi:tRNA pseudouridine synthase Pus10 [Micractinium conductrix]|uniref:tRNA pseudouridine(55) synthase n=1 Tax=Micractinium conductrix TaxID=554055 RepID=A0A2P6VD85_9CHLO|nr:tRNA pseudouridine synthase Pus10 [Micractinium conductrix]|eukprot:PSC72039.1 tRNA pseudouridine synthase Pus10 [Micractinium conductrix]